ncbi:hypothetical protein [Halpernia frigidisoli]|uniref:Uncharacterized protein n=1 Tax=Halpernia frigidisoli TaxID=1125876 RepID=A0A1I3F898_9FLAO|nr:hypothetical protein [Halpernia frigidisoli]SFI07442.1 hypothetical protein SAMN05443292_1213 [Halpernia frigidisoli]
MKNIVLIALFLVFNFGNAQQFSDYKYVYVPKNLKDFKNNKYGLNASVVKSLEKKGYTVIQSEQNEWPQELRQNPCEVAIVNISDTGNFLKNKITFEAKDCHEKVVLSQQGVSSEKDFEIGFKESLEKSMASISASTPTKISAISNETLPVEKSVEVVQKTDLPKPVIIEKVKINASNNFSNGNLTLQKVNISNDKFILVESKSSVPYATFSKSTKNDVFRVLLADGTQTLGYFEDGNYVIEMVNKGGEYIRDIFKK